MMLRRGRKNSSHQSWRTFTLTCRMVSTGHNPFRLIEGDLLCVLVTSSNSTTCPSPEVHPQHGPLPTQPPDSSTENRQTLPLHPTTHQHPSPLPSPPASSHPSSATPSSSQLREQCPSGHVTQYPSGHVTSSSSVFTYSSSLTSTEPYSSSRSSVSEQSNSSSGSLGSKCSMEGALNILHFSYAELSEATDGFTEGMVGIGSFGTVFKAEIRGNGPYAIKKLHTVSV